jgi:hypothetical protein
LLCYGAIRCTGKYKRGSEMGDFHDSRIESIFGNLYVHGNEHGNQITSLIRRKQALFSIVQSLPILRLGHVSFNYIGAYISQIRALMSTFKKAIQVMIN